jgi:superfamily II DNA or RNA helicase
LFASYKLIAEGFNAPILENLVMVTPVKDLRIVVQSIGRVQRPYKNKQLAHVYDLVDDVGKLDKFLRERKKIYKKEGYEVDDRRS